MKADCHMHMVLDGVDWKAAIARHKTIADDGFIHRTLQIYRDLGYTYLRDGGDRWGVGLRARELARDYGITYRTPGAPLCQAGCYGTFIGQGYEDLKEYTQLVKNAGKQGVDFIKIMISGLMDFDRFGVLTQPGLPEKQITQLVHIAHEEGFAVMAHANGGDTVRCAAQAGVDSVEHGAYLNAEALWAMKEAGTVWVPTLSTIGNLRGTGRFSEPDVAKILENALENVHTFYEMGGLLAPGTDAGAWGVPHGSQSEEPLLKQAGVGEEALHRGTAVIAQKFSREESRG